MDLVNKVIIIEGNNYTNIYKILREAGIMYRTGQKPGKGTYRCTECGHLVVLKDVKTTLSTCPKCGAIIFYKVG